MALRNVTSNDDRKPTAVAYLKDASGARAVTMLKHDTVRNTYVGHCLNKGRDTGQSFGFYAVNVDTGELVGHWDSMADYRASPTEPRPEASVRSLAAEARKQVDHEERCKELANIVAKGIEGQVADGTFDTPNKDTADLVAKELREKGLDVEGPYTVGSRWHLTIHPADATRCYDCNDLNNVDYRSGQCTYLCDDCHDRRLKQLPLKDTDKAVGAARTMASQASMASVKRCTRAFLQEGYARRVAAELQRLGMHVDVERRQAQGAAVGVCGWFVDAVWPQPEEHLDSCEEPGCAQPCGRYYDPELEQGDTSQCPYHTKKHEDSGLAEVERQLDTEVVGNARRAELVSWLRANAGYAIQSWSRLMNEAADALEAPTQRELELDAIVHGDDLANVLEAAMARADQYNQPFDGYLRGAVRNVREAIQREAG